MLDTAPTVDAETQRLLTLAGSAKAELNRRIRKLYDEEGQIRDRRAFGALRLDREQFAIRAYLPAINALRGIGVESMQAVRTILLGRLERGWEMLGLDEDGHRLFAALLCQYEAIEEALSGDVLSRAMDRLDTIGQAVR